MAENAQRLLEELRENDIVTLEHFFEIKTRIEGEFGRNIYIYENKSAISNQQNQLSIILDYFNKIVELNDDFDSMEEDLVELERDLDRLNYKDIILSNKLNNQDKRILKAFICRLEKKKYKFFILIFLPLFPPFLMVTPPEGL